MLRDSAHTELLIEDKSSPVGKIVAVLCAFVVTAILIAGYAFMRKRHTQQLIAANLQEEAASPNVPKGPPRAHILVDEALLKGGETIIGGAVKNISSEKLTGLSVNLELKRRKDAAVEQKTLRVDPPDLEPGQEGRYTVRLASQQYSSVRLVGLVAGPGSEALVYTSSQGQKRPPERLEPKVVVVPRARGKGDFLNTPDNPARVP